MSFRLSFTAASLLVLSACSPMIDVHGDAVDPDALTLLKAGETKYIEVQKLLGSPSAKTIFDGEDWIYLQSKQERMAFFKPQETYRQIVVLKFDRDGVLQKVETKTLEQGRAITPDPETTQTGQSSLSVIDQMISNVGRMGTDAPVN